MTEQGRHSRPKIILENRLCQFCNNNSIETEEHFLLHCPLYTEERVYLFSKILLCEEEIFENEINVIFKHILSSNNVNTIFSVCKFILLFMRKRDSITL